MPTDFAISTTQRAMLSQPVSELATGIEKIFLPARSATEKGGPCGANVGCAAASATAAFSSSSFAGDTPPSGPAATVVAPPLALDSVGALAAGALAVVAGSALSLSLPQAAAITPSTRSVDASRT
jgi:hypothetical protein